MSTQITPDALKFNASQGLNDESLAGHFDLTTEEFQAQLKESEELQKALIIGRLQAKLDIQKQLWERAKTSPQFLALMAKLYLGMNEPILEKMSGDAIEVALKKVDVKSKATLAQILGLKSS